VAALKFELLAAAPSRRCSHTCFWRFVMTLQAWRSSALLASVRRFVRCYRCAGTTATVQVT
jgi:hypothetical protein